MSYVQICTGLCASPDIIEVAANNLRELVVEREKKWDLMEAENWDSARRRKVENKYLSDSMGKLIQIAAVTRAWVDADSDDIIDMNIKKAIVGKTLTKDGLERDLEFRWACSGLVHGIAWWLDVDPQGRNKGSSVRVRVEKPLRIESVCLLEFSAIVLKMIEICPACTGVVKTAELEKNGLPLSMPGFDFSNSTATGRV